MKKNVIALLMAVIMASSSIRAVPALATETTAEEAVAVEEENVDEQEETAETAKTTEMAKEAEEDVTESTGKEDAFAEIAEISEKDVIEEEIVTAEENEATQAEDVVDSGTCGENATWTLTGPDNDLTLTIDGSGKMSGYSEANIPWASNCAKITTVIVEEGITYIFDGAFSSMYKLTNVSLPGSIDTFGCYCFENDISLKSITIPNGVTNIGDYMFRGCTHLTIITIPDSVTDIGRGAFSSCISLENITIPESVTDIWGGSFSGCISLENITIPESVTDIGGELFSGCSSLKSITLPEGVTSIGDGAFSDCKSLISITIPEGVTSIGDRVFENCESLTSITLPNNFDEISERLFSGCKSLTDFSIPDGIFRIRTQAFSCCFALKSITIPDEVLIIDTLAFMQCPNLKTIEISDNVIQIGEYAFSNDGGMQSDVYTVQGCAADQYFTSLNAAGLGYTFTMHYPCDPGGHTYGDWEIITEPTCKDTGLKERRCTNCGDSQTESIPVTSNHIWNNDFTVDIEPTYDVEGIESIHCSICDTIKPGSSRMIQKVPKPLNLLTVSGIENRIHNGKEQILNLVVVDGATVLTEGTDYTVAYENNVNVGIAKVTVTGIGHYIGTYTNTFPILPAASSKVTCTNVASGIKVSWVKVEGATSYYVYRDDKLLFRTSALEVTDKEIKYDTGIKFTYRIIASAKGVGNSTKSRTAKMFRLMPVGIKSLTNPSAGKMTVTYDKCSGCYGYVVRYGLNKDMSDANVITVKGENTLSRTFSGMKKGKTYYVQVRTYMLEYGVRYYSGYCTTKTITIKK